MVISFVSELLATTNVKFLRYSSLYDLMKAFPTEESCIRYFESVRWPEGVKSPYADGKVYKCKHGDYKCSVTNKYFNVKTGSMFSGSKIPLKKWMMGMYLFANHKKGISSVYLAAQLSITQKTAWFVLQRIRDTYSTDLRSELEGVVEVDECHIGGKFSSRRRRSYQTSLGKEANPIVNKEIVLGIVERGGRVIMRHVPNKKPSLLLPIIGGSVTKGSTIFSDEYFAYKFLKGDYTHDTVNHMAKEYVRGEVYTNTIENVWSCLKRSLYGTYHWTSKKHLHAYLNEFTFRFNRRKWSDHDRMEDTVRLSFNRKCSYKDIVSRTPYST